MHFEKESAVFKTMQAITKRLDELGIPYAVVGGMAMFMHGYRRFTEDVDILVTKESLQPHPREARRARLRAAVRGQQESAKTPTPAFGSSSS